MELVESLQKGIEDNTFGSLSHGVNYAIKRLKDSSKSECSYKHQYPKNVREKYAGILLLSLLLFCTKIAVLVVQL
jgi:hypothetical protein